MVGILSSTYWPSFAYVEARFRTKFMTGLFRVVSMLPVTFSTICSLAFHDYDVCKKGLITRGLLGIDNNIYGFWGIFIVQD